MTRGRRAGARRSWLWTTATVALLATASCASTAEPDDDAGNGPASAPSGAASTPAATPEPEDPVLSPRPGQVLELDQHGPEYVFTKQGRYAVRLTPELVYEVDAPDMWEVYNGQYFSTSDFSGGTGIFHVFPAPAAETRLPAHACRDRAEVPVGPDARDLGDALAAQPLVEVTRPQPISVGGRRGVSLEVRISDRADPTTCEGGGVALFTATRQPPDWWELEVGEVDTFWVLDVDGERWVVAGVCDTSCTDADFDALAAMAESVTFVRED